MKFLIDVSKDLWIPVFGNEFECKSAKSGFQTDARKVGCVVYIKQFITYHSPSNTLNVWFFHNMKHIDSLLLLYHVIGSI